MDSVNLVDDVSSNPISAWHGVNKKNLQSIYWYGLLNLSTVDDGMYVLLFNSLSDFP